MRTLFNQNSVVWWLKDPQRFNLAFETWRHFPAVDDPRVSLSLSGGIAGYEWIIIGVGFLIDLASHGGSYHHRNRIRGYRRS